MTRMLLGLLLHAGVSAVLAKGRRNRQLQDSDGQPPRTCAGPLGIEGLSVPHARHLVEEPGVELSMSATFINLLPFSVERVWDDNTEQGISQGTMGAYNEESFSESAGTYLGHTFYFRYVDGPRKGQRFQTHPMDLEETLYLVHDGSPEVLESEGYKIRLQQQKWMQHYRRRTGRPWLGFYGEEGPRDAASLKMWSAEVLGQEHKVRSRSLHWNGRGRPKRAASRKSTLELTLTVVSTEPKVLLVSNLLSKAECELIMSLGEEELAESTLGMGEHAFQDETRTSRTGWLQRTRHKVLDHMFKRFADVLRIHESRLVHDGQGVAEQLQVVRYGEQQEYRSHFDFYDTGRAATRFLTLLIYLNDDNTNTSTSRPQQDGDAGADAGGGGTSFPRAFGGRGLQIRPPMGSAVLFYNMHEDGNSDRMTEHAGLPVPEGQGTKWVSNLWVWDPTLY